MQVTENSRPAQRECSIAWTTVVERVRLATRIPAARYPRHAAAEALYDLLAPDGLEVVKLPFRSQWTTQDTRLRLVGEHGLMADLGAVAGEFFVDELVRSHTECGRVLGITESRKTHEDVNLAEFLRALNLAITDYVLQVLPYGQRDKPETLRAVQRALEPIDEARESQRRAASDAAKPASDRAKTVVKADAKAAPPRPSVAPLN